MTEKQMRAEIAKQTARIQSVDPAREFAIIGIFQMKWQGRVLFELLEHSPRRFGELKREVPSISNAVLSGVLRSLEERVLVTREQFNEMPPRVEYALTERGLNALPFLSEAFKWAVNDMNIKNFFCEQCKAIN